MIVLGHIFNKIIYLYMHAYLISGAQNYIYNFLAILLETSLLLISYLQERIFNNFSMGTRKNVITIVAPKNNKATNSICQHTIEDSPTSPLKKNPSSSYMHKLSDFELVSTSNAKGGAYELSSNLKL